MPHDELVWWFFSEDALLLWDGLFGTLVDVWLGL